VPNVQPDPQDPAAPGSPSPDVRAANADSSAGDESKAREFGGPSGPEPTRFGDWEKNGRCIDF